MFEKINLLFGDLDGSFYSICNRKGFSERTHCL